MRKWSSNSFRRLVDEGKPISLGYDGFWQAPDTFKDKRRFDTMHESNARLREVWRHRFRRRPPRPGRQASLGVTLMIVI